MSDLVVGAIVGGRASSLPEQDFLVDCVVFPGQGSQRPGMGLDFAEKSPAARRVFDEASEALGADVAALCASDDGSLNLTENAQPCIVTAAGAMVRALRERGFAPARFGGHNLRTAVKADLA